MDIFKTPETIILNQSLIKAFLIKGNVRDYCPRKIFTKYFLKQQVQETTLNQLRGIYFEREILGGDRFTLPTHKRTGMELLPTQRINKQIAEFKNIVVENLMFVHENINTQIPLIKRYNERFLLKGILDWFPTFMLYNGDIRVAIIDVKLTGDISSDFGEFGWGDYERMDWLQGAMYHHIVHNIDWELNKKLTDTQKRFIQRFDNILNNEEELFMYLVFDYKENPEHKFFESVWDYDKMKYLTNSIDKAIYEIEKNDMLGWEPCPGNECKNCLINCPVRAKIEKQ